MSSVTLNPATIDLRTTDSNTIAFTAINLALMNNETKNLATMKSTPMDTIQGTLQQCT